MGEKNLQRLGIVFILILSFLLNFIRLGQEGLANLYYAAGVKSMLMNWHNFFFVSFDPGGFITIDKPPLGFWLQTLSAKIFGFQGWSIILPQALGGVISVYLIYVLVRRYYGEWAGLISALVLAITPIFVAASRNNTIDTLLVTVVLLAALVFLKAIEESNFKKLLFVFFLIGVGFNIKSLEAFLILPTFYITYLLVPNRRLKMKVVHLSAATLILIASSLPWYLAVDSVPSEERPYVGSSENNSELELATGYNGLGHFLGYGVQRPGRQGQTRQPINPQSQNNTFSGANVNNLTPGATNNARKLGGEIGLPSPIRLFNHQLGGQISWLLPFALIGVFAALYQVKLKMLSKQNKINLFFWGCWLIPEMIFFSIAQGTHRYYLVMMAPSIAALVGISYVTLVNWSKGAGRIRYLLAGAMFVNVAVQATIIAGYNEWRSWMLPLVIGAGVLGAILLVWQAIRGQGERKKYQYVPYGLAFLILVIAPFTWSITPALYGSGNAAFPFAGPDLNTQLGQSNAPGGIFNLSNRFTVDTAKLEDFLMSHRNGEKYIVAVPNAHVASPIIIGTGEPVITYGGFMGSEKILNARSLEELVSSGQVRYILVGSTNNQQPDIDEWVNAHGTLVPESEWQKKSEQENTAPNGGKNSRVSMKLYACYL